MIRKKALLLITFLITNIIYAQKFQNSVFDSILNNNQYKYELRITIENSVLNQLEMIRIYNNKKNEWLIQKYYSTGINEKLIFIQENASSDEAQKVDRLSIKRINKVYHHLLYSSFYHTWLDLLTTNILELPNFERIKYKIRNKKVKIEKDNYSIVEEFKIPPNDGKYYTIEIKNDELFNKININTPYFYINSYPNIDEFIYINDFLNKIENILDKYE